MSNLVLSKCFFYNRAPFEKLNLYFEENNIYVFTGINGKGKTTIISHITDAFYTMAKIGFPSSFENLENKLYRVSSTAFSLDISKMSFVYLRFKNEDRILDYIDISGECTEEEYNSLVLFDNKIPFSRLKNFLDKQSFARVFSENCTKKVIEEVFAKNITSYFPSYRYELPGYLNDPYKQKVKYNYESKFSNTLTNDIENVTSLNDITNWILDMILDNQYLNFNPNQIEIEINKIGLDYLNSFQLKDQIQIILKEYIENNSEIRKNLNKIATYTFISKNKGMLRFGVGKRNSNSSRLQILSTIDNQRIVPTISTISAGEAALLTLFCQILRNADNLANDIKLQDISGIVLIDEIDKHLHIKLQKEVIPELLNLFPKVQFFITSHSPFVNLGLAERLNNRSKLVDLDSGGLLQEISFNSQYKEVYEMMLNENTRFKEKFENLKLKIESSEKLHIVTEGKNTEHIIKAIEVLKPELLSKINVISGSEDKSGDQQLKNAFEILKNGNYVGKFLFVWDCDSIKIVDKIDESYNFYKYNFSLNESNSKVKKGVENLYPESIFTDNFYATTNETDDYGAEKIIKKFEKMKFLNHIKSLSDPNIFSNFNDLILKIDEILRI